jgi:hypothetical protein
MQPQSGLALALSILVMAAQACGSPAPESIDPPPAIGQEAGPDATLPAPAPDSSSPTAAQLRLEVVQSQAWTDRDGNVRANVLLRNPYEFPVAPASTAHANVMNKAGEFMRGQDLYFLDGISGGGGFVLPGETVAANACFTCETTPMSEEWGSVEYLTAVQDASGMWNTSTAVEAVVGAVTFEGDSPIFWVSGTVTNNSGSTLQRISVRVIVFDQAGALVGAAEASAWDVGADATVAFDSYGIGQAPEGPVSYEVTALGVNY